MKYETITKLLDKYWEGESSLEEERTLKQYFSQPIIDERLARYKPLFIAMQAELRQELSAATEAGLSSITESPVMYAQVSNRRLFASLAAAASIIGIAGGIWWTQANQSTAPSNANTVYQEIKDTMDAPEIKAAVPETARSVQQHPGHRPGKVVKHKKTDRRKQQEEAILALQEVKAALLLVSVKLNKGKKEAADKIDALQNLNLIQPPPSKTKEG